jgi:hypothetical protein
VELTIAVAFLHCLRMFDFLLMVHLATLVTLHTGGVPRVPGIVNTIIAAAKLTFIIGAVAVVLVFAV